MESRVPFDNSYSRLPERFFERIRPTPVREPRLLKFNRALASELWSPLNEFSDERLAAYFSGNEILLGADPLAQAYAGHQFGQFVEQLGDGRAVLLGELIDGRGQRRDLQLKGSGPTRFSRRGDGRAALGPVIREYLLGEAMHHLGIPTTRALAIVSTGELVMRERPLPGAVLTRIAKSHIRIGTFEYFASRNDIKGVQTLAEYAIDRHYPLISKTQNKYLAFFDEVIDRVASLVAQWMHVGFIHGVMNTDNIAISGETIDYGPCAFMDEYNPAAVFSSIDRSGRYSFQNQPAIAQWNLGVLGSCLLPLIHENEDHAVAMAEESLERFERIFSDHYISGLLKKFGLSFFQPDDDQLMQEFLSLMTESHADYTLGFRALSRSQGKPLWSMNWQSPEQLESWLTKWRKRCEQEKISPDELSQKMLTVNPAIIPRNHLVEKAIRGAVDHNDWNPIEQLLTALQSPFTDGESILMTPPRPEERVTQTFCGT